ncbi:MULTISPECIES: flagellar biosynthesis protein FlhF [Cycloclasticus]|uniref:Flagellar biosynthesis protein FlhF n=1 Tax=Cycloclasticus pugetii TaxID=34068 RepID=A0AB33Z3X6_9GAMM|nr:MULTISPECIES: flagellar biosynthesis protein FlhF [Cycloclasticus]ATI02883.1 flagellar biosynthesis protein FlhF [Cycloclasticus sp. PY97N]EPD13631.1 GTPase domain-containing protein [Cycloclasticus pugetii]
MKIKRFFAPDMREALKLVKEQLGADAVILSNNRVDGGVEIVAAKDYDEQAIQAAADKKETLLDARLDEELKDDRVSIDWNEPPKQAYREDYTPGHKKPALKQRLAKPKPAKNKPAGVEPTWVEDPAIKAVKHELDMMRHEFRTVLNELSWSDRTQQNPVRIDVIRRLLDTGFSKKLSVKLAETVVTETELEEAWLNCLTLAANSLPIMENKILDDGGLVALVGPTGVGKTTTIAKIAARFRMRHGPDSLALITTDNFRIGAHEQLSNFARILGVPMRVASTEEDFQDALTDFVDKRLVLIDTAGMSQRDIRMTEQFKLLQDDKFEIDNYLVISATTESRAMREVIKTFADAEPKGCILSKLDETDCPGSALSAIIEQQIPLGFVTDGQRVPEDLHYPSASELMATFIEPSELLADEEDIGLSVLLDGSSRHANV